MKAMTLNEIKKHYSSFVHDIRRSKLNKDHVPEKLWPLIPYAEIWGKQDDYEREKVWEKTPSELKAHLENIIEIYDDLLDEWLAGPEATSAETSEEYIAFSAMRMAADF